MKLTIYLYILAIHGILVYLLVPPPPAKEVAIPIPSLASDCVSKREIPKNAQSGKLHTVLVLPHPPNFLEAREIQFLSYHTIEENSRKKVVFKEFSQGKTI